jgi:hypothetical protein
VFRNIALRSDAVTTVNALPFVNIASVLSFFTVNITKQVYDTCF